MRGQKSHQIITRIYYFHRISFFLRFKRLTFFFSFFLYLLIDLYTSIIILIMVLIVSNATDIVHSRQKMNNLFLPKGTSIVCLFFVIFFFSLSI